MTKSCGHRRIISIHSLRVEGDTTRAQEPTATGISIHSLRVEGDTVGNLGHIITPFQSTPSVWRETRYSSSVNLTRSISIHSLRVEGDRTTISRIIFWWISIHSLRVEGDVCTHG